VFSAKPLVLDAAANYSQNSIWAVVECQWGVGLSQKTVPSWSVLLSAERESTALPRLGPMPST
jgi:hypothetical protein